MMNTLSAVFLALSVCPGNSESVFFVAPPDAAIVRDAIERWKKKHERPEEAMEDRIPMVVHLLKQRCVVLSLRSSSVGGVPAYCYELGSDVFIEGLEDVE